MLAVFESAFHERIMSIVRRRQINHVYSVINKKVVNRVVNLGYGIFFGKVDGFGVRAVGDGVKRPALLLESLRHLVGDNPDTEQRPIKIFFSHDNCLLLNQNVTEHRQNFLPVISAGDSPTPVQILPRAQSPRTVSLTNKPVTRVDDGGSGHTR